MYGLDPNNIAIFMHLRGSEVQQVCVGTYDLQYHLHPKGHLRIWSRCELKDASGKTVDIWRGEERSKQFCAFIDLLGAVVSDVSIDDASTLRVSFSDGRQLLLLDDSTKYESFSVDNIIV